MTREQPVTGRAYRDTLAAWASGICLLTATADGERHGLTVSSFCSVSLTPPTVMASIERQGQTRALIQDSRAFGINILRADQRVLAERFAGLLGEGDRFDGNQWTKGAVTEAPLLTDALAWLECRVLQQYEVGEHSVLIGLVLAAQVKDAEATPLLYHQRQWGKFSPEK